MWPRPLQAQVANEAKIYILAILTENDNADVLVQKPDHCANFGPPTLLMRTGAPVCTIRSLPSINRLC